MIWLTFQPQVGHELVGRRPALVLSSAAYNGRVSVAGVVLADQVKSLDWRAREAALITHVSNETAREVLQKLSRLLIA